MGHVDGSDIFEHAINIQVATEKDVRVWRCITIKLKKNTRDGDREITVITNLPVESASALVIAQLYRDRWLIETMFQELESQLHSEINTLGYPKAALFGFCIALATYNVMAVIKSAMKKVHGEEKIKNEVSGYYIAGEIGRTHEGMSVAISPEEWGAMSRFNLREFTALLISLAKNIQLEKYKKNKRGVKKKMPPKISDKHTPHVSTAKLLAKEKVVKKSP